MEELIDWKRQLLRFHKIINQIKQRRIFYMCFLEWTYASVMWVSPFWLISPF